MEYSCFSWLIRKGLKINESLKYSNQVKLFSVLNGLNNYIEYVYEKHFVIPNINVKIYLIELKKILVGNKIDFIF